MIKDYRFVPLENHEPMEEEDDFDEDLFLADYAKKHIDKHKIRLYMAS
jgi:hypothetical protein